MIRIFLISILFNFYIYAENIEFYNTSFDCSNVKKNTIEYKICSNKILSMQDMMLSNIYDVLINTENLNKNKIKNEQREWLNNRNQCNDYQCLKESYIKRVEQLIDIYKLVIQNDFSPYEKINVVNPDEDDSSNTKKHTFKCVYNRTSGLPIVSRDKDFYYIDELSKIIFESKNDIWTLLVLDSFFDKTSGEQILKGLILCENGATYQPMAIEFFTYNTNWNCK